MLREDDAENEGVKIPTAARWLVQASDVKARYMEGWIEAPSATFTVRGGAVFSRLRKSGLRLLCRRCGVGAFGWVRPDARGADPGTGQG